MQVMLKEGGLLTVFKGLPPRLMWSAPLSCFLFLYYEEGKKWMNANMGEMGGGNTYNSLFLAAGPAVLAVGIAIRCPFDIVEQKLQLQTDSRGARQIFNEVYAKEGANGLWRGYSGQLLSVGTFMMAYFGAYETFRRSLISSTSLAESENTMPLVHIIAGASAGFCGACVTMPLDVIKTRLMTGALHGLVKDQQGKVVEYPSVPQAFKAVTQNDGFYALWRGLIPRLSALVPAGAITFCTYELYKSTLAKFEYFKSEAV
jgi:solute carrier family 25 phosphate transporter 23/24/25/41